MFTTDDNDFLPFRQIDAIDLPDDVVIDEPTAPMDPALITRLVGLEYDLAFLQSELHDRAREVAASGVDGAGKASRDLHLARRLVRRALRRLDRPLTEAARAAERLEKPPF